MRRFFIPLGALTLVVLGLLGLIARNARQKREVVEQQLSASFEKHRDAIAADEERWAADALLLPRDGGNAASVLSQHLRWDSADAGLPTPSEPVPEEVARLMYAPIDGGWVNLTDATVMSLDVRWFGALDQFGYWDWESGALDGSPFRLLFDPMPTLVDVQFFAKVRLIQGLTTGTHVEAAREVRALSRLMFTTESLVGSMVGVSLLDIERRAYEAASARGLDVAGWTPVSAEDAARLKAVIGAAPAMADILATGPLAAHEPRVALCAGLRESLGMAHYLRAYLEPELRDRYLALGARLEKSPCRLVRLRKEWASPSTEGQLPTTSTALCRQSPTSSCSGPDVPVGWVPFARSFVGNTVVSIASSNWLRWYEEPAELPPGAPRWLN